MRLNGRSLFTVLVSMILAFTLIQSVSCGGDVIGPSEQGEWFGWAVGEADDFYGYIINTGDGGINWNRQGNASTIPNVMLECIRSLDSLTAWAVGGIADGYGTILKTTDGGATWIRQGNSSMIPGGLCGISPLNASTAWAVGGDNTMLYTSDGGENWTSISDPTYDGFGFQCVYALNESVVWAVGGTMDYGIILRSGDGGNTWESQGDSLLLDGYPLITISVVDATNAWVVGHGYTVASTDDGGENWVIRTPPDLQRTVLSDDANGVTALTPNWILVSMDYGKAYISFNGGISWTQQSIPISDFLLSNCVLDSQNAWIAGTGASSYGGNILCTVNGGSSWSVQNIPENSGLRDVSFVGAHH